MADENDKLRSREFELDDMRRTDKSSGVDVSRCLCAGREGNGRENFVIMQKQREWKKQQRV